MVIANCKQTKDEPKGFTIPPEQENLFEPDLYALCNNLRGLVNRSAERGIGDFFYSDCKRYVLAIQALIHDNLDSQDVSLVSCTLEHMLAFIYKLLLSNKDFHRPSFFEDMRAELSDELRILS